MDAAIDKCTSSLNSEDNWQVILHISDKYASSQPKKCLYSILKKVYDKNVNISLRAVTLLDGCVKNSNNKFIRELSSKEFVNMFKSKYSRLHYLPRKNFLQMIKRLYDEYKNDSEMDLLTSLYHWVRTHHADHYTELNDHLKASEAVKLQAKDKGLEDKEANELAEAIRLSLNETTTKQQKNTSTLLPQINSTYLELNRDANKPSPSTSVATAFPNSADVCVLRALFDFEAVEENELTFKTGDKIILLDDTDENWWRGKKDNIEGLFPSQFVTKEVQQDKNADRSICDNEPDFDESKLSVPPTTNPPSIDPQLLSSCLQMINDADPSGESRADSSELLQLEEKCRAMEPLIYHELEEVDKRFNEVSDLNKKLNDAMQQYHDLMSRTSSNQPVYTNMFPIDPLNLGYQGPATVPFMQPTMEYQPPAATHIPFQQPYPQVPYQSQPIINYQQPVYGSGLVVGQNPGAHNSYGVSIPGYAAPSDMRYPYQQPPDQAKWQP